MTFDFAARLMQLDDDFNVFDGTRVAPDASAIAAFERELGFALEPSYRSFVASCACGAAVAKAEVWPAAVAYEIRPRWGMEHGLELYGLAQGQVPPPLDARGRTTRLGERGVDGWVATAGVLGVNLTLAHDARGRYAWIDGRGEVERVDGTFEQILDARLTQLQADKDRWVAEGATKPAKEKAGGKSAKAIAKALLESPWDAEELLEGAAHIKDEVRAIVLAKLAEKPTAEHIAAAGAVPSAATTAALLDVLAGAAKKNALREAVADALAGAEGDEATAALVGLVDDKKPNVVRAAIKALVQREHPKLVDLLVPRIDGWMTTGEDFMLWTVVETLQEHGADDPRTVPAIASLWDVSVRLEDTTMASNAVFEALAEMAPSDPRTLATFERAAASDNDYLRARGIAGLAAIDRDVRAYIPKLVELLASKDEAIQANAEIAFEKLGESGRATLEEIVKTGKGRAKSAAKRVLEALDED